MLLQLMTTASQFSTVLILLLEREGDVGDARARSFCAAVDAHKQVGAAFAARPEKAGLDALETGQGVICCLFPPWDQWQAPCALK